MDRSSDDTVLRRVVLAFSERYFSDRASGHDHPLSHYLALYPDFEEAIAAEFVNFRKEVAAESKTSAGTGPGRGIADRLGPYTLDREIGRGGQGVVYKATDTRLGRSVALKVLTGLGPGAESQVARFRREAEAASRLDHPGICGVHDAGIEGGIPFIAMRFVEGETLAKRISQTKADTGKTLADSYVGFDDAPEKAERKTKRASKGHSTAPLHDEITRIVSIFEKIANALHAAHDAGVLHRDIKPGNIMVTHDDEPVLLDFGLASIETDEDGPTLTKTGDLFGTPAYMSPEQITGNLVRIDRRSDVYSLGVTLFECLTGARPFEAPTREALYQAVLTKEATDPRRLNRAISTDLKVVIETAIAKDRDKRYQSAHALAEDLRALRENRPIAARPVGPIGRTIRWAKRRPVVAALVLILATGIPLVTGLSGYIWANLPNIEAQKKTLAYKKVETALEAGYYELHEGDADKAVLFFEDALRAEPDSAEAIAGLALAELRLKKPQSAIDTIQAGESRLKDPGVVARVRADALTALGRPAEAEKIMAAAPAINGSLLWFLEGARAMREGHAAPLKSPASEAAFTRAVSLFTLAVQASPRARRAYHFELAHAIGHCAKTIDPTPIGNVLAALWPNSAKAWLWIAFGRHLTDPDGSLEACRRAVALDPENPDALGELGYTLFRKGRAAEAIPVLRKAVGPTSAKSRFRQVLGLSLASTGKADEGLPLLEADIKADPTNTGIYFNYGIALGNANRHEDAIVALEKAKAAAPDDPDVYDCLGTEYDLCGRFDDALAAAKAAVALDPTSASRRNRLGISYWKAKQPEEAIAALKEAVRLDPDQTTSYVTLADILERTNRLDDALAMAKEVVRLTPTSPVAQTLIARIMLAMQRPEDAIAAAQKAITCDSSHAAGHYWLGVARASNGDIARGIESMKKALDLEPNSAVFHGGIGFAHEQAGNLEKAIASYQRAVELDPTHINGHAGLARTLFQLDRFDEAIVHAKAAIAADPTNGDGYFYWVGALVRQEKPEEALATCLKGIAALPKDAYLHDALAGIYFRRGDFEKALTEAETAVGLDPKLAIAHYRHASVLKTIQRSEEAVAAFRRAIALDPNYAEAFCDLGLLLASMGDRFAEAVPMLKKGHTLGLARGDAWTFPSAIWLENTVCAAARALETANHADQAITLLSEYAKDYPDMRDVRVLLKHMKDD